MKNFVLICLMGISFLVCSAKEPQIPLHGTIPFMVYFESRSRGLCVGTLVSRMVVLTAAVCVTGITDVTKDTRPLNVVTGTHYRNAMRGIRVQVTKIVIRKLPEDQGLKAYLLQKLTALLILRRKIPDILTDEPLRAIGVDINGEDKISLHDECIMVGWHFFYSGDKIYPVKRFILQRNMRYQLMNVVNKEMHCEPLVLRYEKATDALGHDGNFAKDDIMCLRDPDFAAQPCHGMYGAPMICSSGRVVGMLMAPDAQWSNCTGYSVLVHQISNRANRNFFSCVKQLFEPEHVLNWGQIKNNRHVEFDPEEEVIENIYDGLLTEFETSEEDTKP